VGERLAAQHRVVAPDLPGYGGTTPQPRDQQPDVGFASELVAALIAHVGATAVLAAHSYGGVVALRTALRGAPVGALALFEPVAMTLLPVAGEPEAFATTRSVFDDYFATHDAGDPRAVRKMIDFWFGDGAFARMPDALTGFLIQQTAANIRDVRAAFREDYSLAALRRLQIPVTTVVGGRSPEVMQRIVRALTRALPDGRLVTWPDADHALTTTHVDAAAELIAGLARARS
jgi:pimeloyl-ACP methyl ester carboxylesterase